MRRRLLAIMVGAVVLSVSACGGKTENGNGAAASGAATVTEKEEKSGLFGAKDKEVQGPFTQINVSGFENVGNDPNNLNNGNNLWGIAFDEEHIYFAANQSLYMADYSGDNVTLLDDTTPNKINRHGDYVYYIRYGSDGCRYNLKTGETEAFFEKEVSGDLSSKGTDYKGYHTVDDFFIVGDYLFYTESEGYNNTSANSSIKVNAIDLTDMTEYTGLRERSGGSSIEMGTFTTDGTYVYNIGETGSTAYRIALDEIKTGGKMEEVTRISFEYDHSLILGSDGFYCADDENKEDKYYVYKYADLAGTEDSSGVREEVLDIGSIPYPGEEIVDNKNFIVGGTFFSLLYNRTLYYYKDMDFNTPQSIDGFNYLECVGCYNDKLYLVDHADGNMRLTTVDADGNYTQTALIPE